MAVNTYPSLVGTQPEWTLIASGTATSGNSVALSSIGGYRTLRFVLTSITTATNSNPQLAFNGTNIYYGFATGFNAVPTWTSTSTGSSTGVALVTTMPSSWGTEIMIENADKAGPHPVNWFLSSSAQGFTGRGLGSGSTLANASVISSVTLSFGATITNAVYYLYGAN